MNEIIKVVDLSMKMGKKQLFKDINFTINEGEIVGLLGHNGVGKSTIQRILANRENATSGQVFNNGEVQNTECEITNVVYVPDKIILIANLSIIENFQLFVKNRQANQEYFEKYIDVIGLKKTDRISSLSKGNQEIVQIIILLSIEADLYLLDEPFSAVDIFRRELIQQIVIDLSFRHENASIIITSHLINEVEPMLSRVIYLNDGRIEIDCELEEILDQNSSLFDYIKDYYGEKVGFKNV